MKLVLRTEKAIISHPNLVNELRVLRQQSFHRIVLENILHIR